MIRYRGCSAVALLLFALVSIPCGCASSGALGDLEKKMGRYEKQLHSMETEVGQLRQKLKAAEDDIVAINTAMPQDEWLKDFFLSRDDFDLFRGDEFATLKSNTADDLGRVRSDTEERITALSGAFDEKLAASKSAIENERTALMLDQDGKFLEMIDTLKEADKWLKSEIDLGIGEVAKLQKAYIKRIDAVEEGINLYITTLKNFQIVWKDVLGEKIDEQIKALERAYEPIDHEQEEAPAAEEEPEKTESPEGDPSEDRSIGDE